MTDRVRVRPADWSRERAPLIELRTRVFVDEQGVAPEIEIDGLDPECLHVIAETSAGTVIGSGRLLPQGRIGRLAVDRAWRGHGVGRVLLEALVACARERGFATVELHAQTGAIGFYEAAGFVAEGPAFDDAGIPHRRMTRRLTGQRETGQA